MQNTQQNDNADQTQPQAQDEPAKGIASMLPVEGQDSQAVAAAHPVIASDPETAEDADLIEKEWVAKAKEVVESTKGNPHAQSDQMRHVRADYIKKRYNRDVQAG